MKRWVVIGAIAAGVLACSGDETCEPGDAGDGCGAGGGAPGGGGGSAGSGTCDPTAYHCNYLTFCIEYSTADGPQQNCGVAGGTWAIGACDTSAHGVGGCRSPVGTACKIEWYPAGEDASSLRTACEADGGTWVEP